MVQRSLNVTRTWLTMLIIVALFLFPSIANTEGTLPTGGTVTTIGDKTVHVFTGSGTFTVPEGVSGTAEYLVVGGGGGGASGNMPSSSGGGGGGGGVRTGLITISGGTYTVTVGAGGAGGEWDGANIIPGSKGADSTFGDIVAAGGGGGGATGDARNGGSGGGWGGLGNTPATDPPQGYNGGNNLRNPVSPQSPGGGGAGGAAPDIIGEVILGAGGPGITNSITGEAVGYAGGGGGGACCSVADGVCGNSSATHGGGRGGYNQDITAQLAYAGTPNTGGGGGGGGYTNGTLPGSGKAGGSGIVVISYTTSDFVPSSVITSTTGENGSISPSGSVSVVNGTNKTFTITPNENYHVAVVLVDGSSVGAVSSYEFTNVTAPHTISATFAINSYSITATAGENGSITPSGATSVNHGGTQTYTITPNEGYLIADVLVDESSVGTVSTYDFTNVIANHTISASFKLNSYTVTATAGANGSISPSGTTIVTYGNAQSYTITPDDGYSVADVLVNESSVGAVNNYEFSSTMLPTKNPVQATGGTVTTVGNKTIHTFTAGGTFTVPEGVTGNIEVLVVGGGGGGATGGGGGGGVVYSTSYPVNAQTYSVVVGAGGAGATETTSPAASPAGDSGQDSAFGSLVAKGGGGGGGNNAYPDNAPLTGGSGGGGGYSSTTQVPGAAGTDTQGYSGGNNAGYLANPYPAGGGGGAGSGGGNATANNIAGNGGTGLVFSISGSPVGYAGGGGGGLWGNGTAGSATHGAGAGGANAAGTSGTPNTGGGGGGAGYLQTGGAGGSGIVIVSYETAMFGTDAPVPPQTISATFAINTYTITASAGTNGSITPSGATSVNHGGSQTYTITPNEGYRIVDVLVDGSSVGAVSAYEFTNVTGNHTLSATFEVNTYALTVAKDGTGTGTVTSSPAGIDCGETCSFSFSNGTSVTLTANAATGSIFSGWSGACTGNEPSCEVSMTEAKNAIASFTLSTYSITATAGENGSITPSGVTAVSHGGSQTYTITPNENYHVAVVLVDGSSVGAVSSYTFENVTAAHTIDVLLEHDTRTITASAGGGGSISPSGAVLVNTGANQLFSITANEGYHIADVLVDGSSVGAVASHEFVNVSNAHTVSATFAINTYTITATSGENGTITPSGDTSVNHGASQAYTITPADGYYIADVLVDGSSVGAVTTYEFTGISSAHAISATFGSITYAVTATAGENGSINPAGITAVNQGSSQAYTIVPADGYSIEDVLVDGLSAGAISSYVFENVTSEHTISATFALKTYTVTASSNSGGSVTPSGATTVNHGGSQSYTITPDENYRISDVLVDGASVGAVNAYEFTNVTSAHTISVQFGIDTYSITASSGAGGTIAPSGETTVGYGSSQVFTVTPNAGYHIVDLLVDGGSVGALETYEFTNVTSAHTISATFAVNTYAITATAGENGTITPSGETTLNYGGSQEYTIAPSGSYHVEDVLVDGASVGAVTSYLFSNVTEPHTIHASFTIDGWTITASASSGGVITPSGSVRVDHGATQAFSIVPDENYVVLDVTVNGESVGAVSTYEFTNVTGNNAISVQFARALPVLENVVCTEGAYPGQEVVCTATATAANGTVAYDWVASTGAVIEKEDNYLKVSFNTSGSKLITAKAYLVEDPERYVIMQANIEISTIDINLALDCPSQAIKGEFFECTVTGDTPIGTLSYVWSVSTGNIVQEDSKATIKSDRSGTLTVTVNAVHSSNPALTKTVAETVSIALANDLTPVVKGQRYPYINTPTEYIVEAPCLLKGACTTKIEVNGVEHEGASATFSFPEPGKYTLTVVTTLNGEDLKKTITYNVYAEPMPKPIMTLQGPSALFAEESYTYTVAVAERHKVLPVMIEWTLPDNSTVEGSEVTLSPTQGGIIQLVCKGWIDGYRETTERILVKRINVVAYVFPKPEIYVRFPEGVAPYNVALAAKNTVKPTPGAPYRMVYNWDFGDGETLTTQKESVTHQYNKIGTYTVRMTATDHKGNVNTSEAIINAGTPPLEIALKASYSNTAVRTPLTAYIRSSITKRTSLDRLESYEWRVNDVVQEGQPEYIRVTFTEAGEYEVSYKAVMKSGVFGTQTINITVNPNIPPECSIEYTDDPKTKYVTYKAGCTDIDGRLSAFKWDIGDGRGYRSGFTRISAKVVESGTYSIKLQATDDAGGVTEVIREIPIAR